MKNDLNYLFQPSSIAVIGASDNIENAGYSIFKNLKDGFKGKLYAVNPNRDKVQGIACYPSVKKIKIDVDLAIIATPAPTVPSIIKECGQAHIKTVVVISAGFKASGSSGERLIQSALKTLKQHNMRMLGPNCLGFINPSLNINASFAKTPALPGHIALISQSGAICSSILDWARTQNVGFKYFVSIGDMADISYSDLIDYFAQDPQVSSIVIYMESLANARSFISSARAFTRRKPIIILKSGTSQEGAQAAQSHTGNLAGNDVAYDAAFRRAGILRVSTIEELFDMAQTLTLKTSISNNRLAIVTNAGGPGVIATDALIKNGGRLGEFSKETQKILTERLPKHASINNPVDILGDARDELFQIAVEATLADNGVDGVLVIVTPQTMTDCPAIARALTEVKNPENKPVFTCFMGVESIEKAETIVEKNGIRNYNSPEDAITSFLNLFHNTQSIKTLYQTPSALPSKFNPRTEKARILLNKVIKKGRTALTERQAKRLLSYYDIPVTENYLARSPQEAVEYAEKAGFPVILKIVSPDILHKTEVGGYRLNIHSKKQVEEAYSEILASVGKAQPDARIDGILIEKMQRKKYELFLGAKKDPLFGPVILFGTGGTAVEVFKDISSELPPLNMMLAKNLMKRTKICTLLEGFRSTQGTNITNIAFILYKFAYVVSDFPEISDIDINPLAVDAESEIVLDVKILLDKDALGKRIRPYSHLAISPYPSQYTFNIQAKDGKKVMIRPVKPEDEQLVGELFTMSSTKSQELCIPGSLGQTSHEILAQCTNIDYDRDMALVAEIIEDGKKRIIGNIRLHIDPYHTSAEIALIVGDPWRGLGIGSKLLDSVMLVAQKEGISKIHSKVLEENNILMQMLKKRKFKIEKVEGFLKAERRLAP